MCGVGGWLFFVLSLETPAAVLVELGKLGLPCCKLHAAVHGGLKNVSASRTDGARWCTFPPATGWAQAIPAINGVGHGEVPSGVLCNGLLFPFLSSPLNKVWNLVSPFLMSLCTFQIISSNDPSPIPSRVVW